MDNEVISTFKRFMYYTQNLSKIFPANLYMTINMGPIFGMFEHLILTKCSLKVICFVKFLRTSADFFSASSTSVICLVIVPQTFYSRKRWVTKSWRTRKFIQQMWLRRNIHDGAVMSYFSNALYNNNDFVVSFSCSMTNIRSLRSTRRILWRGTCIIQTK